MTNVFVNAGVVETRYNLLFSTPQGIISRKSGVS